MKHFILLVLLVCGCAFGGFLLGEADPEAIPESPTYSEHVQPIIEYYCVACHYPGQSARALLAQDGAATKELSLGALSLPYSDDDDDDDDDGDDGGSGIINAGEDPDLSTYEAVVEEFEDVAEAIFEDRDMPPGASRRLTPREETILARWAAQGFAP